MQELQELPLQQLAAYAAQSSIKGSSFKRNSLLKPLDTDRRPVADNPRQILLIL